MQKPFCLLPFFFFLFFSASICMAESLSNCINQDGPVSDSCHHLIAKLLGWHDEPNASGLCQGYYQEPLLGYTQNRQISPGETIISSDYANIKQDGKSTLKGNVSVQQTTTTLTASTANITRDNKTSQITQVDLYGQVTARNPGHLLISDEAHLQLVENKGTLINTLYRLSLSDKDSRKYGISELYGLNAWGQAHVATQTSPGHYKLERATYSTCPISNHSWELSGYNMELNRQTGKGTARHVVLKVTDFPVFYMPYIKFPIDDRRTTGFLFPTIGTSSDSGLDISIPFYINLAPNYDDTFTPRILSKRGVMLNNEFRYLTHSSHGQLVVSVLPNDTEFEKFQQTESSANPGNPLVPDLLADSNDRTFIHYSNYTAINQHWFSTVEFNYVSDPYYFQDFGRGLVETTRNQLLRQIDVNYANNYWSFLTRLQDYQTLHPLNQSDIKEQYSRLPQVLLNGNYYDTTSHLHYYLESSFDHFEINADPVTGMVNPNGDRAYSYPIIKAPFHSKKGYITPSAGVHTTYYSLHSQPMGFSENIDRVLPIVSLDSGLFFEKNITYHEHHLLQTLEPRILYLYVPYDNQNDIPLFDTSLNIFSFEQLFRTNRFNGLDRVGDANQVSLALTTRIMDHFTGEELFRGSLGQIFYFRDRKVTLCNTPGCIDEPTDVGATSNSDSSSPVVANAVYRFYPHWHGEGEMAIDPDNGQINNANFNFHYQSDGNHVFNMGYDFIRNGDSLTPVTPGNPTITKNLSQTNVSLAWALNKNWHALGHWSYNISHQRTQIYLAGLEYNSCCWAMRVLGGRTFQNLDPQGRSSFENLFYIQFLLKGLGNIGNSDPSGMLATQIPGYKDRFI